MLTVHHRHIGAHCVFMHIMYTVFCVLFSHGSKLYVGLCSIVIMFCLTVILSINNYYLPHHRLVLCITSCRMLLLGYLTKVKSHPFISLSSLQRQTDIGRCKGNVHRRSWATIDLEIIFETKCEVLSLATSTEVGLCRVCCV